MRIIFKKLKRLITANFFTFIGISFILSGVIFLLNLLIVIFVYANYFGQQTQKKLGIYIYIKDTESSWTWQQVKERPLAKAFKLKDELESKWLEVYYQSKEDALKRLEVLNPWISRVFNKFWFGNPLMDTFYVIIKDKNQYEIVNKILPKYKDIIDDIGDMLKWKDFQAQKKRIQQILELINFLNKMFIFLILLVLVLIIILLIFMIKINFYNFYSQIEVDKLLGSSYLIIQLPFILKIFIILIISFILSGVYYYLVVLNLSWFLKNIFDINIYDIVMSNISTIGIVVLSEFAILSIVSSIISYIILKKLIKSI